MDNLEIRHDPRVQRQRSPAAAQEQLRLPADRRLRPAADEPAELLNRWIVPLENRYDYLTLATGKKIQVPFEQLIIFSTNLEPKRPGRTRRSSAAFPTRSRSPIRTRSSFTSCSSCTRNRLTASIAPKSWSNCSHALPSAKAADAPLPSPRPFEPGAQLLPYNDLPMEMRPEYFDASCKATSRSCKAWRERARLEVRDSGFGMFYSGGRLFRRRSSGHNAFPSPRPLTPEPRTLFYAPRPHRPRPLHHQPPASCRAAVPNSLAVVNANDILPTNADGSLLIVPNNDLFYLTGVEQEESILLVAPHAADEKQREILFVRETNERLQVWEGHKHTKEEAADLSGVKTVKWLSELRTVFHQLMCEAEHVYLNSNEHRRAEIEVPTRDARFVAECRQRYPLHDYQRLARIMHKLHVVKAQPEIDLLRRAVSITDDGFRRVLSFVKPGVYEYEVEAELIHEFTRRQAGWAFPPIIAAGKNSCVLHYNVNDMPCQDGDVLLLDFAANYANYNADVTRTIPIGGRFTARQQTGLRRRPPVPRPDLRSNRGQASS